MANDGMSMKDDVTFVLTRTEPTQTPKEDNDDQEG